MTLLGFFAGKTCGIRIHRLKRRSSKPVWGGPIIRGIKSVKRVFDFANFLTTTPFLIPRIFPRNYVCRHFLSKCGPNLRSSLIKRPPQNKETLLRKHRCGNTILLIFPCLRALETLWKHFLRLRNKKCFWMFSETFAAATNVTNVSCARKRGNDVTETFYAMLQQQLNVSRHLRGLYTVESSELFIFVMTLLFTEILWFSTSACWLF